MLVIYYDNPNEASDMYLKWLTKDCKEKNIEYEIVDNFEEYYNSYKKFSTLPMMPVKDNKIINYLRFNSHYDIDNTSGDNFYSDATAQGIFNHIKGIHPDRGGTIAVIGRGKVGKALIDMLIEYGYTVFEFNSRSFTKKMFDVCYGYANIVVGLSSENVFDNIHSEILLANGKKLIDASNTFDTKNKLRCGKWTRDVILSRV